jgi:HK97 family phage major capsid protein
MLTRAYSTLDIKSIDREQRIVEGVASTPELDRGGDSMMPEGAEYRLPIPFLWFHNALDPIGQVIEARVQTDGIYIRARVSKVDKPGRLKTLVDEAWAAFTADPPLVRGLSIGWSPIESEPIKGTKFRRVLRWVWGELSAVSIPMNVGATILAVKQFDQDQAASGPHSPSDSGSSTVVRVAKDARVMTTQEQIASFESKRAANVAAMNTLMLKSEGSTLDEPQREEYTTLEREVETIDEHLPRLRKLEKMNQLSATPITPTTSAATASELRGGSTTTTPIVTVTPNVPKGTAFTRMAMAIAAGGGDSYKSIDLAQRKEWDNTPEVEMMVKAAVAAGTTTDSTWAGPLAVAQPLVNEFLELLRPKTLIGRIPGFTQVPFNVSVPSQTGGGTYSWVGQGNAKPVTSAAFATVSVPFAKAAGIIVLTKELVKLSSPSAEALVRNEMIKGMGQFLDTQLVDPAVAVSAGVNPASITNGATTAATFGVTAAFARQDLVRAAMTFTAAELSLSESVWLMNESNALALAIALNALGQPMFPGFTGEGGTLMGAKVVVTNAVGNRLILVHTPSILFADEGGVQIDVSQEASVQMDSAPSNPSDATTVMVSFFQRNLVGLRAERMITWIRARTAAVHYTTAVAYTGA